ncbi:MAG: sigma-70 family RNA polymerase sigma factor [Bacteroidetes bacterium]|nr:MAG: sigma-70 family RNA polymerase sigma factor [Bacteroidota bacterium]
MNSPKDNHITDAELLENYQHDGNNEWLGILLQRYTLLLFGVCMKYLKNEEEAKDAVQQIFLKSITELQKYKVEYFKSWLYMVAKNYCLMALRDKGKATIAIKEQWLPIDNNDEPGFITHIEKDQLLTLMQESLDELSDDQKKCVSLFYLEKKSYHEIADQTGFTLMQVKSHIQNGKRNLKLAMEKKLKERNHTNNH